LASSELGRPGCRQKARRYRYGTSSEVTGGYTHQSDRENHSRKLSVASGRFTRGGVRWLSARLNWAFRAKPPALTKVLSFGNLATNL